MAHIAPLFLLKVAVKLSPGSLLLRSVMLSFHLLDGVQAIVPLKEIEYGVYGDPTILLTITYPKPYFIYSSMAHVDCVPGGPLTLLVTNAWKLIVNTTQTEHRMSPIYEVLYGRK